MDDKRALLRHFLAALAYRTQKALRDAPPNFESFRATPESRTPHDGCRLFATPFFIFMKLWAMWPGTLR